MTLTALQLSESLKLKLGRIKIKNKIKTWFKSSSNHKFKRNFQDTLNPVCNCGGDIVALCHYLLHCLLYTNERLALLNVIQDIDNSILELTDSHIIEVLLYERKFLDISSNPIILSATIDFLFKTKRSDEILF